MSSRQGPRYPRLIAITFLPPSLSSVARCRWVTVDIEVPSARVRLLHPPQCGSASSVASGPARISLQWLLWQQHQAHAACDWAARASAVKLCCGLWWLETAEPVAELCGTITFQCQSLEVWINWIIHFQEILHNHSMLNKLQVNTHTQTKSNKSMGHELRNGNNRL